MDWYWIWRSRGFRLCAVIVTIIILLIVVITSIVFSLNEDLTPLEKAERLLADVILVDGYNDFATNVRSIVHNDFHLFNFSQNLSEIEPWASNKFSQTDLFRLRKGGVKAQFWVARAECDSQFKDAVETTIEQIDVIRRLIHNYSSEMSFVTSYNDLMEAAKENKIASLISVCCGQSIQWSFAILRIYYELGVRSMTLTPAMCSTPWGDSAGVDSPNATTRLRAWSNGLSAFGQDIIVEMNRLGMIIDISQSSIGTMKEVLHVSNAPVIFSHSAARALCNNEKNIPDDVLKLVRQKDSVVMVTFYPGVLKCDGTNTSIQDVVAHIEYIRNRTTIENVGIGSDFDSVDVVTEGLEDVSKFPNLFAALIETGRWIDSDLEKLAGQNILRVLQEVESVRDSMVDVTPRQSWIKLSDLKKLGFDGSCTPYASVENPPAPFDVSKFIIPKIKIK